MVLYSALSRIFPNSFATKLFVVCLIGTHVPLFAVVAWLLFLGGDASGTTVLAVVLCATIAALGLTFWAVHALLRPVMDTAASLERWDLTGLRPKLPQGYGDEVGRLMAACDVIMQRAAMTLDQHRREAETDPLTGALNLRGMERVLRHPPEGWVIAIDLDGFKALNDAHGHGAGDDVLRRAVAAWTRALRPGDMLARIGGDEFLVFLPCVTAEIATIVAHRLRGVTASVAQAPLGPVTASFGLSYHPGGPITAETRKAADDALYDAKRAGRDRIRCADGLDVAA